MSEKRAAEAVWGVVPAVFLTNLVHMTTFHFVMSHGPRYLALAIYAMKILNEPAVSHALQIFKTINL